MSAHVLISGTIFRSPEQKVSKSGNPPMRLVPPIACLASMLLASCASKDWADSSRVEPVQELKNSEAPRDLDKPCEKPAPLPEGGLAAGAVERLWGRDRVALASCGERHAANVTWRKNRDAGLAGAWQ